MIKPANQLSRTHFLGSLLIRTTFSIPRFTHLLRWDFEPFCQSSSAISSKPLNGKSRPKDFLPWPLTPEVKIRATSGDLLLVSRNQREFGICNPLTKQSLALPQAPENSAAYFGLVSESKTCDKQLRCNCNIKFRVVLISHNCFDNGEILLLATIFCSETGQWTKSRFAHTALLSNAKATHYWMISNRIIAFDPFDHPARRRDIELPDGVSCSAPVYLLGCCLNMNNVLIGSVHGRLRLSQLTMNGRDCPSLKVWELNYSSGDRSSPWWLLVHNTTVNTDPQVRLRVVAFHPDDGDVIFLCRRRDSDDENNYKEAHQYNIAKGMFETDGKLPWLDIWKMSRSGKVFALSHTSWPTLIPPLPIV